MKGFAKLHIKEFKSNNPFIGFSVLITVICVLNIVFNTINGRFWLSDFKVYYMAAKSLLSGGQVYLQSFSDGSGFYKYSPFTLFFFLPYCIFNYTVASIIHFSILSFSFWYTFIILRKILIDFFTPGSIKHEVLLLSLSFLCILLHLVRELYLGNVNIVLLMLCTLALRNYLSGKPLLGSILFGIVLLTKPFFLILLIPLVLRKQWKALLWLSLILIAGLSLPFLFLGYEKSFFLYSAWIKTMLIHDQGFPGMNSVEYILQHYFYEGIPYYTEYIIILITGIAISFFILLNMSKEHKSLKIREPANKNLIFEWFIILALIPNLVKTDSEHFLNSAPIIIFIIYYIGSTRKYWLIPVMIILIFFYGGNSYDLLGKDLSMNLFSMGLLGLSNILIVFLSLVLFLDFRKKMWISRDKEGNSF
jgi:Glycosyltransferase family 87